MKKVTGKGSYLHYSELDYETGELTNSRKPEYTTMSRRPGIGKTWYDKYKDDIFPRDYVVLNNKKIQPPRYYLNQYEFSDPEAFLRLKGIRSRNAKLPGSLLESSPERLAIRHAVKLSKLATLSRKLDEDI
jgi:hypothetical protein